MEEEGDTQLKPEQPVKPSAATARSKPVDPLEGLKDMLSQPEMGSSGEPSRSLEELASYEPSSVGPEVHDIPHLRIEAYVRMLREDP